jgi:nucleoside-diphosphate-sugar epimerase
MDRNDGKTALVLGATGGIGGEVARQLREAGWQVRALTRRSASVADSPAGLQWLPGDAMNRDDVLRAARGCAVIVHAVNPPGYRRWAELVLPMLDNTIAAARAVGATIVLPGTVYNFGPDTWPVLREDSPQNPATRKGAIRAEMERRLRAASREGVRCIVVRAGDFFGPRAASNWFAQGLIRSGRPVTVVTQPGRVGIGHQWSYLPDVARTMRLLLERRDTLAPFADFHLRGHWDADGTQMVEAIRRVVQARTGAQPAVRRFPWPLLTLAAPFVTLFREMREMRYLWREPLRMDNAKLVAVLGDEPHTPLDAAVEATLVGLGCLPAAHPAADQRSSSFRYTGGSAERPRLT